MFAFFLILVIFYVAPTSSLKKAVDDLAIGPVEPTGPFPICYVRCVETGSPVCAIRRGVKKLFLSRCSVLIHHCNTGEIWNEVDLLICTTTICPINCCKYYDSDPLCATNKAGTSMTFAGRCAFANYACLHPDEGWDQHPCPYPTMETMFPSQ